PGVTEGKTAARGPNDPDPPPAAGAPESATQPRPAPAPRAGFRGVLAGALAGLVVSALAVGALYSLLAPGADVEGSANRVAQLGAQVQQANAARDAEAKRESAAVASLDKRVSALETSGGASGQLDKGVAALETAQP